MIDGILINLAFIGVLFLIVNAYKSGYEEEMNKYKQEQIDRKIEILKKYIEEKLREDTYNE